MVFLNNRLVPEEKALVSVFDHGFLYGDGVYETIRAYNGIPFMIDEHIRRLYRSASMISLKIPLNHEMIRKAIYKTMKANDLRDAVVRVSISRGKGPIGLDPELCHEPTFVIIAYPFKGHPARNYQYGISVAIVKTRRNYKGALNPMIKSLNFLNNILARIEAKAMGAYEAIMLNHRGYIAEGTISNIFFLKDGTLCTPSIDVGILDGITRGLIIDIAKGMGIRVDEGMFRSEDIYDADEVFISSTTMELMPVNMVDDVKVRSCPGRITRLLHKAYKKRVKCELVKET
ncbi:MAG: branched-chain-amino-acid transaminase [Thermodesulfovibrionia bacterium]